MEAFHHHTRNIRKYQIKLLIETKPIVCALPAERQARNPEVRGSNPGTGSSFSLEIL